MFARRTQQHGATLRLRAGGAPRLCINMSPRQALDANLARHVLDAVEAANIAPSALTLDFTEAALSIAPPEHVRTLRRAGVGVGIDDFGVTTAGPAILRSMALSSVRIDRCIVQLVGKDGDADEVVRTAVSLGSLHGIEVGAVGVETAEQRDWLREAGCTTLQGYLFGRPEAAPALSA